MSRATGTQGFFSFTGGINSEFSATNYPENAAVDLVNVDLGANGVVSRRRSLVGEPTASHFSINPVTAPKSNAVNTFLWKNADNVAEQNFVVVQVEDKVYVYETASTGITGTNFRTVITLPNWNGAVVHFSTADGNLLVCHESALPEVIAYDSSGNSFSNSTLPVSIRDFAGIPVSHADDFHPVGPKGVEEQHWYNLINQGWDDAKIDTYQTAQANMPSNSQIWHISKSETDNSFGATEVANLANFDFGSTRAPRGRVFLDIANPDVSRNAAISGTPVATPVATNNYPSVSAGFSSRAFFAQGSSNNNRPRIMFSQLLSSTGDDIETLGKCYQRNDPTADTFNELLETDGGVIDIPEMGIVKGMEVVQNSLLVLADNGVWQVSGAGSALTATNISVNRVTNIGAANGTSIVNVGDSVFYWAESGIFKLSYDAQSFAFSSSSVSANSIQTMFNNRFPQRQLTKGSFDLRTGKIVWYIPPALDSMAPSFDSKDYFLILDLRSGAFSTYEAAKVSTSPYGLSIVAVEEEDVTDLPFNGNLLVDAVSRIPLNIKVVTLDPLGSISDPAHTDSLTFSTFTGAPGGEDVLGETTSDWKVLTGWNTLGDPSRSKDVVYLTTFFNRTETTFTGTGDSDIDPLSESGCLGRIFWDWSDGNDNRVSKTQQLYRLGRYYVPASNSSEFTYGKDVITTKTKMRGAGKAMQFEFTNDESKDCQLIGWSLEATVGAIV